MRVAGDIARAARAAGRRWPEIVAALACVFFAGALLWEAFGPLDCGHYCSACTVAIGGENMIKWRILGAVQYYYAQTPPLSSYYAHHPDGCFYAAAIAHVLFGHGPFTVRAPPILMSICSAPLVWALARALWGRIAGAVATVFFVLMPIDLAFGNLSGLEVITIFGGLLFSWGTVRLWQTWEPRYQWPALAGALITCNGDWIGMVFVGLVVGFAMLRGYVLPRDWFGPVHERQHARWICAAIAAATFTFAFHLYLFAHAGKLGDLLGSYDLRSAGADIPFLQAIQAPRRWMWIRWTLPFIASSLLVPGLVVAVIRLARGRAVEAIFPCWALIALVQYAAFKQGADIHVFWPHHFGLAIALAAGSLAAAVEHASARASAAMAPAVARAFRVVMVPTLVLAGAAYVAVLGRTSLTLLRQSRVTSGRFDEGGNLTTTNRDRAVFAEWATRHLGADYELGVYRYPQDANVEYAARRPLHPVHAMTTTDPDSTERYVAVDTRLASAAELATIAQHFAPVAVGPFWRVDRALGPDDIVAEAYVERQPRGLERYFLSGTDLLPEIGDTVDPWATWEWRWLLDEPAQAREPAEPSTPEQVRIAYDMAVVRHDDARASALRARLLDGIAVRRDVRFTHGVTLLGWTVERGPATVATLYWQTTGDWRPFDGNFAIRSKVVAPPRFWFSALDYFDKDVAPAASAHTGLWKPNGIFVQRFMVPHRVGTEVYEGVFVDTGTPSEAPTPLAGPPRTPLFTLD